MFGLAIIEIITILGIIISLPLTYIGLRNYFKQKPFFQFVITYYENNKSIWGWGIKISNVTSSSFILKKVFIKKHFLLFIYKNKIELNWYPYVDINSKSFDSTDSIKPDTDLNIVVKNQLKSDMNKKYFPLDSLVKNIKLIFETTLNNYTLYIPKNLLTDPNKKTIKFKTNPPISTLKIDDLDSNKESKEINKLIQEIQKPIVNQSYIKKQDLFKGWEFLNKYGIWKYGDIYYCSNCKTNNIVSPLKVLETGWRCPRKDCKNFYPNEKYKPPKRNRGTGPNPITNY